MKTRPATEIKKLETLAWESMRAEGEQQYENAKGEVFVYQEGELVAYTDTRVINHHNDRLVNLREDPFSDEIDNAA